MSRLRILQSAALTTILCASVPCSSHPREDSAAPHLIGIKPLFGLAAFYRNSGSNRISYRYGVSYGAGAYGYLDMHAGSWGHIGIQPELLWVRRATRAVIDDTILSDSYRLDSIDLAVLGRASYSVSDRVTLHAAAGPRLGFQLDAKRTDINGNIQDLDDLRKFELGVSIAAGGAIELMPRFSLMLEGRYDQGLVDIANADEEVDLRHRAFFLMLGVSMGFGGPAPESADASPVP